MTSRPSWSLVLLAGLLLSGCIPSAAASEVGLFYRPIRPADPFHVRLSSPPASGEARDDPAGRVLLAGPRASSDTRATYRPVYPPGPWRAVRENPDNLKRLDPPVHVPGFVTVTPIDFRPVFEEAYLARYAERLREGVERRVDYQIIVRNEGGLDVMLSVASVAGGDAGHRWDGALRIMNLDGDPEPEIETWRVAFNGGSGVAEATDRPHGELSIRRFDWDGERFDEVSERTYELQEPSDPASEGSSRSE